MARIHRITIQKKIFMTQITTNVITQLKVIPQLEPNILECEVKWTLGSISMNKATGGDGIPDAAADAVKVLHSICQ